MQINLLQLKDFTITKLSINFLKMRKPPERVSYNLEVKTDHKRDNKNKQLFFVQLKVSVTPEPRFGYKIQANILGRFIAPEGLSEKVLSDLVPSNGTLILYGILRGATGIVHKFLPRWKSYSSDNSHQMSQSIHIVNRLFSKERENIAI